MTSPIFSPEIHPIVFPKLLNMPPKEMSPLGAGMRFKTIYNSVFTIDRISEEKSHVKK